MDSTGTRSVTHPRAPDPSSPLRGFGSSCALCNSNSPLRVGKRRHILIRVELTCQHRAAVPGRGWVGRVTQSALLSAMLRKVLVGGTSWWFQALAVWCPKSPSPSKDTLIILAIFCKVNLKSCLHSLLLFGGSAWTEDLQSFSNFSPQPLVCRSFFPRSPFESVMLETIRLAIRLQEGSVIHGEANVVENDYLCDNKSGILLEIMRQCRDACFSLELSSTLNNGCSVRNFLCATSTFNFGHANPVHSSS